MKKQKVIDVKIKQDEEQPVVVEVMAQAVIDLSRAAQKLLNGPLKREAIVALIHDRSKVNKGIINIVLNNLEQLESYWIRKVAK